MESNNQFLINNDKQGVGNDAQVVLENQGGFNNTMNFNSQFISNNDNREIQYATKDDVQKILENQESTQRLIKRLFEEIKLMQNDQAIHNSHIKNSTSILPKNPFENKNDFLNFEHTIQDSEENFLNLMKELKEKATGNSTKFIKNCWRLMIQDNIGQEFCWQGSPTKMALKHFSTMLAVKMAYVQKFTEHTDAEFEKSVIMYFQQAKNRCTKKVQNKKNLFH